jgi:putative membrane protein
MMPPRSSQPAPESRRNAYGLLLFLLLPLCLAGGLALSTLSPGPLAHHMSVHILLMNLVAPTVAVALHAVSQFEFTRWASRSLFAASAAQIAALWLLHAPPVLAASINSAAAHFLVQTILFAVALWFWIAIVAQTGAARWRAIFALLVTGKLFCLLAALLVFSPRALYPLHLAHDAHAIADPLADQYLAGLLMLVVCPLTYVFAGVLIAERWLSELRRQDAGTVPRISSVQ